VRAGRAEADAVAALLLRHLPDSTSRVSDRTPLNDVDEEEHNRDDEENV
jgi:hypothetical protein